MVESDIGSRSTILVLDDDPEVCASLRFLLEIEGFEVHTYQSPQKLLGEATLPDFACLLIDYHMPTMNGLEVTEALRRRRGHVPAILMTSNPTKQVREQSAAAGLPLLEKPAPGNRLLDCIRALINRQ